MDPTRPRVLFLSPPRDDYMADGLLHGLRTLLGGNVVDVPKHEILYRTHPESERRSLRGRGFTLYGLLEDVPCERAHAIERAKAGEFDLVVFSDIWRGFGQFTELAFELPRTNTRVAVIDGSDRTEMYPYAGQWWRVPAWWFLPRAHTRFPYFKREITAETTFFRWYLVVPRVLAGKLPVPRNVHPISFSIPMEKIVVTAPEKDREFASHVVDGEVAWRLGRPGTGYTFSRESEYYADLRRSRFGITTKRAGWDAMRHYEIAANGCVPCFRNLDRKPRLCPPYGLDGTNCLTYRNYDDLARQLSVLDHEAYRRLRFGALAWARANSSCARASQLLRELGFEPPPVPRDERASPAHTPR